LAIKEWIVSDSSPPPSAAEAPYYLAAAFTDERRAGRAYNRAAELLFATEGCDLSAYRFYVGPTWYVAIVGEAPTLALEQQLRRILTYGRLTPLPPEFIESLMQRRAEATKQGEWVERHYRLDR
jgi:hypothetical protein